MEWKHFYKNVILTALDQEGRDLLNAEISVKDIEESIGSLKMEKQRAPMA